MESRVLSAGPFAGALASVLPSSASASSGRSSMWRSQATVVWMLGHGGRLRGLRRPPGRLPRSGGRTEGNRCGWSLSAHALRTRNRALRGEQAQRFGDEIGSFVEAFLIRQPGNEPLTGIGVVRRGFDRRCEVTYRFWDV